MEKPVIFIVYLIIEETVASGVASEGSLGLHLSENVRVAVKNGTTTRADGRLKRLKGSFVRHRVMTSCHFAVHHRVETENFQRMKNLFPRLTTEETTRQ